MSKNKKFDPKAYRDLRFIPARGSFLGLPDFGITETFTRLAGKQPDKVFIGKGFGARPYKIEPEAIVDAQDQATLFDKDGTYIGGSLPQGPGVVQKPPTVEDKPLDLGNESAVPKKTNKEKAIDFTKDFIERSLLRRQQEDANLRFGANLQNQQLDALSARNKMALDTQFAFSKFDTSQIAKNQLRAAQREQTMFDAVSRMADVSRLAGAQGSGPRGRAGGA
jgi:hypothetical protein